ncbi:MAG TPA: superinfection immunity protein [Actinotalea sp.]|nr:superinfection immunity protein [Actinotalea sp.]
MPSHSHDGEDELADLVGRQAVPSPAVPRSPLPETLPATVALVPYPPPPPVGALRALYPTQHLAAAWPAVPSTLVVTDRREPPAAVLVAAWALALLTLGYLLPWAVAATRGRSNHGGVAVVNVLLGWTLAGWAVALVMACTVHRPVLVQVFGAPPPGHHAPGTVVSW